MAALSFAIQKAVFMTSWSALVENFFFFFFQGPWPTAKASLLTIKVEIRNTYSHVDNQSSDHKLHIHKL